MALLFYYYVRKNQVKKLSQLKNLTEIFRKFIILTINNISAIKAFQTAGVLFGPMVFCLDLSRLQMQEKAVSGLKISQSNNYLS